ncbi:unnamed protein product [Meloidogyne enterolobii]|uniref:Uncharacterized protein n=1 Tax=Meloidogyne enterolobii TaxID=390850 RepID=A0ACB0ZGE7_MELEN
MVRLFPFFHPICLSNFCLQSNKKDYKKEELRLSDNDFDAWLEELGLLHGKRTCHKCVHF